MVTLPSSKTYAYVNPFLDNLGMRHPQFPARLETGEESNQADQRGMIASPERPSTGPEASDFHVRGAKSPPGQDPVKPSASCSKLLDVRTSLATHLNSTSRAD